MQFRPQMPRQIQHHVNYNDVAELSIIILVILVLYKWLHLHRRLLGIPSANTQTHCFNHLIDKALLLHLKQSSLRIALHLNTSKS